MISAYLVRAKDTFGRVRESVVWAASPKLAALASGEQVLSVRRCDGWSGVPLELSTSGTQDP